MLKKLISISLIVAILTTLVRFTLPYLWYYSNYDYIAHELCENRHDPDADCDGKCQLKKMVQKQHDRDDHESAPPVVKEQRINLYFTGSAHISVISTSFSLPFFGHSDQMKSLWFGEPVSPPPQKG